MNQMPLWLALAALSNLGILGALYYCAVRRLISSVEVLVPCLLINALSVGSGMLFLTHVQLGEYAALQTIGIALFAPLFFEVFSVDRLIDKEALEAQSQFVRTLLSGTLMSVGMTVTFVVVEAALHLLQVTRADYLILIISASAMIATTALVGLMVAVQPIDSARKRAKRRAAGRLLLTRSNVLAVNSILVYAGLALGLSGTNATVATTVLFFLNLVAGNLFTFHNDGPALDSEQANPEQRRHLVESTSIASTEAKRLPTQEVVSCSTVTPVAEEAAEVVFLPENADNSLQKRNNPKPSLPSGF